MKTIHITCPEYQFENLDLDKVSKCIDNALIENFADKNIVLRGIQSKKHDLPKDQLVRQIQETGFDRTGSDDINAVKVNNRHIDIFGLACVVKRPITLPILEGFHKWKPKSLERPQTQVDIWMVYDATKLSNVEYFHSHYKVMAHDGYVFKDPTNKPDFLLGILVID